MGASRALTGISLRLWLDSSQASMNPGFGGSQPGFAGVEVTQGNVSSHSQLHNRLQEGREPLGVSEQGLQQVTFAQVCEKRMEHDAWSSGACAPLQASSMHMGTCLHATRSQRCTAPRVHW